MSDQKNEIAKTSKGLMPISIEEVEGKIVEIRGQKVLLDRDVAELYGVETKRINEAVKNNPRKFREGYMFELSAEESSALRSKFSAIEALRSNFSTIEPISNRGLNFFIGKLKHTVKWVRKDASKREQ